MSAKTRLTFEGDNRTGRAFGKIDRALGGLSGKLGGLNSIARQVGAALGGIFSLRFGQQIIDEADNIGKLADQLGVSVEELSQYIFIAKQAGITTENFSTAIQRLRRRAQEAAEGNGEAVKTFQALNIDAAKFAKLGLDDQMQVLATKFDAANKGAAGLKEGMKLLDSEGVANLRFLNDGAVALEGYRKKAEELGVTLSEHTVKSAAEFNNAILEGTERLKAFARDAAGGFELLFKQKVVAPLTSAYDATKKWIEQQFQLNGILQNVAQQWRFYSAGVGAAADKTEDAADKAKKLAESVQLIGQVSDEQLNKAVKFLEAYSLGLKQASEAAAGLQLDELLKNKDLFGTFQNDPHAFDGLTFAIENAIFAGAQRGAKGLVEAILFEVEANLIHQLASSIANAIGTSGGQGVLGGIGKVLGFAEGGIVPGPKGAPQLAVVHGGESVIPAGAGSGGVTIFQTINAQGATDPAAVKRAVSEGQRATIAAVSDLLKRGKIGR